MAKCVECGNEYEIGSDWVNNKLCKDCFRKDRPLKSNLEGDEHNTNYTSSYGTARTIAQIVSAIGWITVFIGCIALIAVIISATQSRYGFQWVGLVPAFSSILSGLFLVMGGQVTRAVVDNTDNTGRMLVLLTQQTKSKE